MERGQPAEVMQDSLHPATTYTLSQCEATSEKRSQLAFEIDDGNRQAENARSDALNVVFGTSVSFLSFALGLYFVGWCIGWISGGFRRAG